MTLSADSILQPVKDLLGQTDQSDGLKLYKGTEEELNNWMACGTEPKQHCFPDLRFDFANHMHLVPADENLRFQSRVNYARIARHALESLKQVRAGKPGEAQCVQGRRTEAAADEKSDAGIARRFPSQLPEAVY